MPNKQDLNMVVSTDKQDSKHKKWVQALPRWLGIASLFAVLFILLTFGNYRFASTNPGGNDFLIPWIGARSFFTEGISPYSDKVDTKVDMLVYGHLSGPGDMELPLSYPVYYLILYLPFALVRDYSLARASWMTVQEIALIATAFLSLSLVGWKPKRWLLIIYLVFSVIWYHALRALINGNIVILVTLGIAASLWLIRNKNDAPAGILLGLVTIKPNVVLPVILGISVWAIYSKRWRLVTWMVGTVALLSTFWLLFIPDWPLQNLHEIQRYPSYPPGTPSAIFGAWLPGLGSWIGLAVSLGIVILLVREWIRTPRNNFPAFLWTTCLTLAVSPWVGITSDPGNFILASLSLTLLLAYSTYRFDNLFCLVFMLFSFIGLWALFLATIIQIDQPTQNPIMFFPLPAILLIGLFLIKGKIYSTVEVVATQSSPSFDEIEHLS